uniref:Leukosialin n=2 Tax=Felis catus TaxID=9685 RepID=A0ABI8AA94_FELCA
MELSSHSSCGSRAGGAGCRGGVGGARATSFPPGAHLPSPAPASGGVGVVWSQPCALIKSLLPLTPVAMGMILLLLLFGGVWTQETNSKLVDVATTLGMSAPTRPSASLTPTFSEPPNLSVVTPSPATARVREESNGTGPQISPPSSASYTANEVFFLGASTTAGGDLHVPEPSVSGEVATKKSSNLETNAQSLEDFLELHIMTDGTTVTGSLETSDVTRGPSVTMATGPPETSDVTWGPSVTMATGPPETSDVTWGPSATMATGPPETSDVTWGPSATMATGPPETSDVTWGPSATMATGPPETSDVTWGPSATMATGPPEISDVARGPSATMATGSLKTSDVASVTPLAMSTGFLARPKGPRGFPTSSAKTTPVSTGTGSRHPSLVPKKNGSLLVAVVVALVVFTILVTLLLLWRRRQKRRTGALILSRGGKRNGVVDAWAGPAQVSDEEALTAAAGGSGGGKGPGVSEGEASGQRPTLTTFFDRRKSQPGSLELEELKARPPPVLNGEEEPLVGSKDEAVEAPASQGPEAGDVEAPQCL